MTAAVQPAPRRAFNLPAAAVRVESAKLSEQLTVRLLLAVCVVAPVGFALVMRLQSALPADTLFGRWAKDSGAAASLTVLGFAGTLGLPFAAGVLAGDVFSSEDRHGTWKTILTRSCTRADVFAGKVAAAALAATAAVAALGASSVAGALLVVGSDDLVGLSGQTIPADRAAGLALASWAYVLLPTLAFVALALLLSVASRSGIVGVLGPAVVGLVLQLLALVASGEIVRALLPSTPFDAWHALFTEPAHAGPLVQGAITSLLYALVFLAAAWHLLRRRTFAGSEASSHTGRRTALRTAIAVAVLVAALVVASGLGPSTVTAPRLESAIAPSFERLVLLQYRLRTHEPPSARSAVRVRTSCTRANGAVRGPGDDWACVVTIVRPEVRGTSLTLDVTARANGCYTAEAPPAAVGPKLVRDTSGRPFTNPLATFDGCFGTS